MYGRNLNNSNKIFAKISIDTIHNEKNKNRMFAMSKAIIILKQKNYSVDNLHFVNCRSSTV